VVIFNHLTYLWWFVLNYCNYDDEASFRQILKPIIEHLLLISHTCTCTGIYIYVQIIILK
jgi:hypothetical protein